jgi:predicted dithiol-disulfide oxidoreductase (DUF899 family)
MLFVSQAPLEKLQTYKRRMGWSFPWVSSAGSDFNFDLGYSRTEDQTRQAIAPMLEQLPPIADQNANSSGTDLFAEKTLPNSQRIAGPLGVVMVGGGVLLLATTLVGGMASGME